MTSTNRHNAIDHIFRHEYGKIIAILVHKFGPNHLEKIEDVVQDAFLKAMKIWSYQTIPNKPTAWLLRVANNGLIDLFRKDKKRYEGEVFELLSKQSASKEQEISLQNSIQDCQLKMIFACCNPALSAEYQIILSLKLIGGFSNKEISRALLKKEETVAKSFTRAKKQFREKVKTLEIPIEMGLASRISLVLKVIYLLFTEGYIASTGEVIIKKDICYEAIRMALLLTKNSSTNVSEVHGLIALMCFHVSRFEARVDEKGALVDMEHQNRAQYNQELIQQGMRHFYMAKSKNAQNPLYFLQSAVSYFYSSAKTYEEIDWYEILEVYDAQLRYSYSPIIRLNRIVPYYKVHGAAKGLIALDEIYRDIDLTKNALYYSIKAQLLTELHHSTYAKEAYNQAIEFTKNEIQRNHLIKKRSQLT